MTSPHTNDHTPWAVFLIFLRLGLTSFGGPIAHLGYFRNEFVIQRQWLTERSYADLVGLCQFLPGPASSQVGMAIGLSRCGYAGALAAWAGFTLPSAIALFGFALGMANYGDTLPSGALQGLKVVTVAVVSQAVWGMARNLCPDAPRITLMAAATCLVLLVPSVWGQMGVMACAAIIGMLLLKPQHHTTHDALPIVIPRQHGAALVDVVLHSAARAAAPFSHKPKSGIVDGGCFLPFGSTGFCWWARRIAAAPGRGCTNWLG